MPLAEVFQNQSDLKKRIDVRIRDLRQEYYGRIIDENDDSIEKLQDILNLLNDCTFYSEMHKKGMGNHSIANILLELEILTESEATEIVKQLPPRVPLQ